MEPKYAIIAFIVIGGILVFYGLISSNSSGFNEKGWYSFDEGMKKAKEENKEVLVFVTLPTCVWCERMKKETFSDKDVMKRLEAKYVPVLVDASKDSAINKIAPLFGGDISTPAFVIYSPDGKPIDGWVGYLSKEEFIKRVGI